MPTARPYTAHAQSDRMPTSRPSSRKSSKANSFLNTLNRASNAGRRPTTNPGPEKVSSSESTQNMDGAYFDAFKKEDLRELLAQCTASWLLSPDFRGQAGLPIGLISNIILSQQPTMTLLFPKEEGVPELEYREIHQIIRELTIGIFAVNQMPSLSLEPNFDLSTTCQYPMAYKDTRVGQIMVAVDYAMKSLWHGVGLNKAKREKLMERWRTLLDVSTSTGDYDKEGKDPFAEFTTAGQEYTTSDERMADIYKKTNSINPSDLVAQQESQFFNTYSDHIRLMMNFHVSRVRCSTNTNVIACDAGYDVTSSLLLADDDFISPTSLQRINRQLRHQVELINEALPINPATRKNIELLKIINIVSLLLVALRKRLMTVPDIYSLLTELSIELRRTETELPPFAIGPKGSHPNEFFTIDENGERKQMTHTHGGIQFDYDTTDIEQITDEEYCKRVRDSAADYIEQIGQRRPKQEYSVPTTFLDGKEYYVIRVPLTTYYPASPPLPVWLHAKYQQISSLRPRKLPMNDLQIAELFKSVFGFRRALSNKNVETGMRMCACRGLVAPFIALMRKTPSSSLMSHDMQGMTVLHDVCIHNRAAILSLLLSQNPKLNIKRSDVNDKQTSGTPLHYASRTGSLECLTALMSSKVNLIISDGCGRTAIHHAAAADQLPIVRSLLRRKPDLLEVPALSNDNSTPLLAAASSGALTTMKFLVECGADMTKRDIHGDSVVNRAALNFHAEMLKYFVNLGEEYSEQVWKCLVNMLQSSSEARQDASLRCLEMILHETPSYWRPLYDAGVVDPLVNLLRSRKRRPKSAVSTVACITEEVSPSPIRSIACSVLCLMSVEEDIRNAVALAGAIPLLVEMLEPASSMIRLGTPNQDDRGESFDERCDLHSRSSVVLSDLAYGNATSIADHGGIPPLVELLQTDVVDLLINVVNTLGALCRGDTDGSGYIQSLIVQNNAAPSLVEFLRVRDDNLQAATSETIAEVCKKNRDNQNEFVRIGVLTPLVEILRGHCIAAQMKAALAVGCITELNLEAQEEAEEEKAPEALCRLFQIWSDSVQERGASALWCLAGQHPAQQRRISELIGCKQIIEMLISKSDILQYIGCQAVAAWSRNSRKSQQFLGENGAIPPLIRLLRLERTSRNVLLAVIAAINSLCIGVAHINCEVTQKLVAGEGAVELLLERIWRLPHDESMQVDLFHCLACVVTGCHENEQRLNENDKFEFDILLRLINSPRTAVKFGALSSLALFAFNRIPQQQRIARVGDIDLEDFEELFESDNLIFRVGAAFQLVVLARMVFGSNVVEVTARGIIILVDAVDCDTNDSSNHDVILSAASYLASLAHTRAGIPDAFVTSGAVMKLLQHLRSRHDGVRQAAAQALGYLTFNRTASRELMSVCRGKYGLYESVVENLGEDGRISDEFVAEFKRQITIGLPIPKTASECSSKPRPKSVPVHNSPSKFNRATIAKTRRSRFVHIETPTFINKSS